MKPVEMTKQSVFLCKHCHKPVDKVRIEGISLICPYCGKLAEDM